MGVFVGVGAGVKVWVGVGVEVCVGVGVANRVAISGPQPRIRKNKKTANSKSELFFFIERLL
jgi:hypothetical protein